MDTYSILREFADSWALLVLFVFFIGVWFWAFRPKSRDLHDEIANSIFRNETAPGAPSDRDDPDSGSETLTQELRP
ncbi:cbb3-type cytochrome c oxidase subunit 3 [Aestuariibius sp. 2305UL40-4]|uniref:cbb3-type cytochrome c oxidase subunit 3 n=1 Tax=Aestuariibius violaceus TaxID=3234132 RepID=UPI00345E64D2